MTYDISHLPDDPEFLKAIIISLQATVDRLSDDLRCQSQTNAELQDMVNKLTAEVRRLTLLFEKFFNKSSEKLPKDEPSVEPPEGSEPETSEAVPQRKKREKNGGGGRSALPEGLERVEKVIDVPEAERRCDCCEALFKWIGDERSEQLHFKPMELFIVIQVLRKYMAVCDCSEKRSASAEPPIRPIAKALRFR